MQKLRQKASAQGNLKESKEQKVITEQVAQQTVIKIEPADPQVVYVPSYNPTVVYGAWPYPAYPPYYYPLLRLLRGRWSGRIYRWCDRRRCDLG